MLLTEQDQLRQDISGWVVHYGGNRSALLPVLQEIQRKHHHVSGFAMQVVADLLGIHPVEVYSVVSFYSFFDAHPKGKFIIRLCRTISCDMVENHRVARQLENDLGISFGQTTPDGKFTLQWTNCLGMCDQGPALLVNDVVYTRVTPTRVHEILDACIRSLGAFAHQAKQEANV
jgi:NADH-quinone oxidoreductase E subunit